MTPYTGPLAAPIRSTIKAVAVQKRIPATVELKYDPAVEPFAIDVHWLETDQGFIISESEQTKAMTDDQIARYVAKEVNRYLHPRKVQRHKKRRR